MKTVLLFYVLTVVAFSESHNDKGSIGQRKRPHEADLLSPFSFTNKAALTARDIESGSWVPDEEGGCDQVKGCAYKNQETGEVRFLSAGEKNKLKEKKEATSAPSESEGKITELKDKASWDEKFDSEKGKKAIVLIFSAADCGPCKALKAKLEKEETSAVSLYTAIRPTYRSVQGHKLHEEFKNSIGGSVPVAFIYTPDKNGQWKGKILKGNQIYSAIQEAN